METLGGAALILEISDNPNPHPRPLSRRRGEQGGSLSFRETSDRSRQPLWLPLPSGEGWGEGPE